VVWQNQGEYPWGASWYLFDLLCLIDCQLHGAPGALDEIKWRGALDFKLGGTYYESMDTVTGKLGRANQGWDAAVYAIWTKLMAQGHVDHSLLEAVDKLYTGTMQSKRTPALIPAFSPRRRESLSARDEINYLVACQTRTMRLFPLQQRC